MRFFRHETYKKVDTSKTYRTGRVTIFFRSEQKAFVYWQKDKRSKTILAAYSDQPFQVEMPEGYFSVSCEGDVFMSSSIADQTTVKVHDEVFTSLDRPAPMSPEMLAVHRLIRANEVQREEFSRRMEHAERRALEGTTLRSTEQSGGSDSMVLEEPVSETKEKEGAKAGRSKAKIKASPGKADDDQSGVDEVSN